jgi:uncharacterized protein (PEP-CTERM system associated)
MSKREAETPALPGQVDDFSAGSTVEQTGGGLVWNWRITPFSASTTTLGYSRNETPATGRDDYRYFRVGLNTQIGPRTSGSVFFQRLQNDARVATSSYTENQVAAALRMSF